MFESVCVCVCVLLCSLCEGVCRCGKGFALIELTNMSPSDSFGIPEGCMGVLFFGPKGSYWGQGGDHSIPGQP